MPPLLARWLAVSRRSGKYCRRFGLSNAASEIVKFSHELDQLLNALKQSKCGNSIAITHKLAPYATAKNAGKYPVNGDGMHEGRELSNAGGILFDKRRMRHVNAGAGWRGSQCWGRAARVRMVADHVSGCPSGVRRPPAVTEIPAARRTAFNSPAWQKARADERSCIEAAKLRH